MTKEKLLKIYDDYKRVLIEDCLEYVKMALVEGKVIDYCGKVVVTDRYLLFCVNNVEELLNQPTKICAMSGVLDFTYQDDIVNYIEYILYSRYIEDYDWNMTHYSSVLKYVIEPIIEDIKQIDISDIVDMDTINNIKPNPKFSKRYIRTNLNLKQWLLENLTLDSKISVVGNMIPYSFERDDIIQNEYLVESIILHLDLTNVANVSICKKIGNFYEYYSFCRMGNKLYYLKAENLKNNMLAVSNEIDTDLPKYVFCDVGGQRIMCELNEM